MRATPLTAALILLLTACSGERSAESGGQTASTASATSTASPATSTAEAVASLPADAQGPFRTVMLNYEAIHKALANDSTTGVVASATAAGAAARELEAASADPIRLMYTSIATEAEELAADAGDLTTARKNFGELSKAVISLLVAKPDLAKGRVVVECPMTSTYKKWLQTDEKVRNPYYGSTMLECGTVSKLEL